MSIRFSPLVRDALDHGEPVVGLETGMITHALPRPLNLPIALGIERELHDAQCVPATIGMIKGEAVIGLTAEELEHLAGAEDMHRITVRDLPFAKAKGLTGGVSLAAAVHLAHQVGIKVCATTGLGGVHQTHSVDTILQESSDLTALADHPIVLVTSGVRPMLDVPGTLQRLETLAVPVLGYRSDAFAGFYVTDSGYKTDHRVDSAREIADVAKARDELGLGQALLISNPIPESMQIEDFAEHMSKALVIAAETMPAGADETQVLLATLESVTGGEAWRVNTELYRRNADLAAQIAKLLATTPYYTD